MKKVWVPVILTLVGLTVVGLLFWPHVYHRDGIQEYDEKHGNSYLDTDDPRYMLPSLTFIKDYPYVESGYHWYSYDNPLGFNTIDKTILNLTYSKETYFLAKKFSLDNCYLDSKAYTYNNYMFYENLTIQFSLNEAGHSDIKKRRFPYYFIMFGYNDVKDTLVYIGFYCAADHYKEADIAKTDWGAFLKKYYNEFYDFDA